MNLLGNVFARLPFHGIVLAVTFGFSLFRVEASPSPRETVTRGCTLIGGVLAYSRVLLYPGTEGFEPLVWAGKDASGGDPGGVPGCLPVPGWIGRFGDGKVVVWAGHEMFFGKEADGKQDNDLFRKQLFSWLLEGGKRVGFSSGHGEWFKKQNLSPVLASTLASSGVLSADEGAPLSAETLAKYDLVVVGNPWKTFTPAERAALWHWTRRGGSLLVLGLGWSWFKYNDDPDGSTYPVNVLGEAFGWIVRDGSIRDPLPPAQDAKGTVFAIRPLSEYVPVAVVTDVEDEKAANALVGEHFVLCLDGADMAALADRRAAKAALDSVYLAQAALVGDSILPFGGKPVWIQPSRERDASWYMASGNPILYKAEAGKDVVESLNGKGRPGWGIAHESGHNFVYRSCGDLFVLSGGGTGESWANVFTVYSYLENGWSWKDDLARDPFADGRAFHRDPKGGLARLKKDPWILLGCLSLIWEAHGWEGMRSFMAKTARLASTKPKAQTDEWKMDWTVRELSLSYGRNLSGPFARWGYSFSAETERILAGLPRAILGER